MATVGNGEARRNGRLKSWKEIAAFFGADERTVRRWEERGLPIRRVPGGGRATVYAEIDELQAWLQRSREAGAGAPEAALPSQPAQRPRPRRMLAAGAAVLFLGAAGAALWIAGREAPPVAPARQPATKAVNLYLSATYESERMTLDSVRRAITLFGQAIAEDPSYAEPYAGLATAWLRLRTFGAVSEGEGHRQARAAAERALQLNPDLPAAHTAMGFIRFYGEWEFAAGLDHFRRVSELDPRNAGGHHSYGMALLHVGRFDEALREIDAAQRLDPRSRGIRAEKGIALYLAGRREEGLGLLREMAAEDPDFIQPHRFLAMIYHGEGNYPAALDHAAAGARLSQDQAGAALIDEARRALEQRGPQAMFRIFLDAREERHRAGQEPAYTLAQIHALIGDRDAALHHLRRSIERREPEALMLRVDPMLNGLRGDPEYQRLAERFGPSA